MKITASLNVELVAVERNEEVSALIELTAPAAAGDVERPPTRLVVVLDRSGSMSGGRLEEAKRSLCQLVHRLHPTDSFGLVTFDDTVAVPVAAAALADKAAVVDRIRAVQAGGTTDLGAGYLRGVQEARRVGRDGGATLLLVSDGHANTGLTDPDALADVAATAAGQGVTTAALGFGLGYDETLLSAIAKGGRGNEMFAEDADAAGTAISGEIDGLLSQNIQAASLLVAMSPHVRGVRTVNEVDAAMVADGLQLELGGFYADETRKLLLTFDVPGMPALGLTQVATLTLRYVDMATMREHVVALPLHVNIVPGDEAARRIVDSAVVTELAYQQAQRAKRNASRHLSRGDLVAAEKALDEAREVVGSAVSTAPPAMAAELREEQVLLDQLKAEAEHGGSIRAAKAMSMDVTYKSRNRGRQRPSA